MKPGPNRTLDELCFDLGMLDPADRPAFLDDVAQTRPEHARDLLDFAAALAFDELRPVVEGPTVADDDPAVLRALERFWALIDQRHGSS